MARFQQYAASVWKITKDIIREGTEKSVPVRCISHHSKAYWISCILACTEHEALPEHQRSTFHWLYGLWSLCGRNQEGKGGVVYATVHPAKRARTCDKTQKGSVNENDLNAGYFLFIKPAVSQAAACDGTTVTTSAKSQEFVPGTLPTY